MRTGFFVLATPATVAMTDFVITSATATIRRRLGPVAWLVLEELLLGAGPTAGTNATPLSCPGSVRELAKRLELDKDTIARAMHRLIDAGLITRGQARTAGGTFARTAYLVEIPDGLLVIPTGPATPAPPPSSTSADPTTADLTSTTTSPTRPTRPARATSPTSPSSQLSLLEL